MNAAHHICAAGPDPALRLDIIERSCMRTLLCSAASTPAPEAVEPKHVGHAASSLENTMAKLDLAHMST